MPDPLSLARGACGPAVRDLKTRLARLGYGAAGRTPSNEPLDEFGPDAETAIRRFQAARGLRVDGICGRQTWGTLVEAGYVLGDRLLYLRRPKLRGDDVAALQQSLNGLGFDAGKEDGIFGPHTDEGLRDFQRNAGATVDGICGPEALTLLERVGRDTGGSVARVKEREAVLREPSLLAAKRVFVATEPGLDVLADGIRRELAAARADVVAETTIDDQSKLAVEANAWEAEIVVFLRFGDHPSASCAFYARGDFRSERGHRLAECVLHALSGDLPTNPEPDGKAYALLRETRAPAVVCELPAEASGAVVERAAELARALVTGIRMAVEQTPTG